MNENHYVNLIMRRIDAEGKGKLDLKTFVSLMKPVKADI
jgi:Ca2+-binding EF-hand superfamily protein